MLKNQTAEPCTFKLQDFLAPFAEEEFFRDYLSKKPLHLQSTPFRLEASPFCLSLADMCIQAFNWKYNDRYRFVRDNTSIWGHMHDKCEGKPIEEWISRGWSLVCNNLAADLVWFRRFTAQLSGELKAKVQVNAYYTPAGSKCFRMHSDSHDVLIWQIMGEKFWEVTPPGPKPETLPRQLEVTLQEGDLLYLPEGYPHRAQTQTRDSLHLTIGFNSTAKQAREALARGLQQWACPRDTLPKELLPTNRPEAIEKEHLMQLLTEFEEWARENIETPTIPESKLDPLEFVALQKDLLELDLNSHIRLSHSCSLETKEEGALLKTEWQEQGFRPKFAMGLERIVEAGQMEVSELMPNPAESLALATVLLASGLARVDEPA